MPLVFEQFEKWSDGQRKKIIDDVVRMSKESQLHYVQGLVSVRVATRELDFTRIFPRVLTLYLFSFLDPRTLCRCAQVSYLKNIFFGFIVAICQLNSAMNMQPMESIWLTTAATFDRNRFSWNVNYYFS